MARPPNYGQQRADVNRSKQAKKEAKQRERDEAVARRKATGQDLEPEAGTDVDADKPARD
ncbi:hypothetical protein [Roseomonas sp. HF4]|uniref:hypothetical protein n=1 Tax=Roseomonas sp. HF4 TaxID=2562313 RepID=UPI0010C01F2B|nr:hypothetical protein [Roseomonas sp. HF4]